MKRSKRSRTFAELVEASLHDMPQAAEHALFILQADQVPARCSDACVQAGRWLPIILMSSVR